MIGWRQQTDGRRIANLSNPTKRAALNRELNVMGVGNCVSGIFPALFISKSISFSAVILQVKPLQGVMLALDTIHLF